MNKPHKHAALIKAWADGAEIQAKALLDKWISVPHPEWSEYMEYRIKPTPREYRLFTDEFLGIHIGCTTDKTWRPTRKGFKWLSPWLVLDEEYHGD